MIGSTSFQIFDILGKFKKGLISLNLWPFYRHEARLVCAGEFWGVRDTANQEEKLGDQFARLIIETQKFENELY